MDQTLIKVLLPSEFADEVEQFVAEHPEGVTVERQSQGAEAAADLGFEPITAIAVTSFLLKFAAGVASSLANKLLVDRIWKRLQSSGSDERLTEVQIAFPSGYLLTVRSEAVMTAEQLRQLIKENIR